MWSLSKPLNSVIVAPSQLGYILVNELSCIPVELYLKQKNRWWARLAHGLYAFANPWSRVEVAIREWHVVIFMLPLHACLVTQSYQTLRPFGLYPARLLSPWDSPGRTTGVGCHSLLHGIFLTWRSNPCLLHLLQWQAGSLSLVPPGKHVYLQWSCMDVRAGL